MALREKEGAVDLTAEEESFPVPSRMPSRRECILKAATLTICLPESGK